MIKQVFFGLSALLGLLTMHLSCGVHLQRESSDAITAKVIFQIPMVLPSGDMKVFQDSFFITRFKNLTVLRSPYNHFYEDTTGRIDTVVQYQHFMFKQQDTLGYLFDSLGAVSPRMLHIDSFMQVKAFGGALRLFDISNMRLLSKKFRIVNRSSQYVYLPIHKVNENYGDTCIVDFQNGMPSLPFTLSGYLDSLGLGKAVRMEVKIAAQPKSSHRAMLPERTFVFAVMPTPAVNSHVLQKWLHMYENIKSDSLWYSLEESF